jgi:hypothetical protein
LCDGRLAAVPAVPDLRARGPAWLAALAWLWLLAALPFLTDTACNVFAGLLLLLTWVPLALAWAVEALAWRWHAWSRRWLLAAGAALGLGVALAFTDAGLAARAALSRPWLDAYARGVPLNGGESTHETRLVGLFLVDGTENVDGVVFLYTNQGWLDRYGLAYVPSQQEGVPISHRSTRPLLGRWHAFRWKF